LIIIDVDSKRELAHLDLVGAPGEVVATAGGSLAVTLPQASKVQVVAFDGKALQPVCDVDTPSEPAALAMTPAGERLLVTSGWGQMLTAFSSATLREEFRVPLGRDPHSVVVEDDGRRAFVSHTVGGQVSVVDLAKRTVSHVNLNLPSPAERQASQANAFVASSSGIVKAVAEAPAQMVEAFAGFSARPERIANQAFALALSHNPEGRVLVPLVEVNPGDPTQRSGGYGSPGEVAAVPAVAVFDQETLEVTPPFLEQTQRWGVPALVAGSEACLLPRSAQVDAARSMLLVSCLGSDMVVGYDAASPSPIEAEILRVPVASGPTGLAIDEGHQRAVVWSQFERTLSVVSWAQLDELDPEPQKAVAIALPAVEGRGLDANLALGRRLFHMTEDPRLAADGRACASCHVGGRDDGLTWSTPHGPRRTKMLAGLLEGTAPYSWDGAALDVEAQLSHTFARLSGQGGLRSQDLRSLVSYIQSLPVPPAAREVNDALIERGRVVFASEGTGCAECHGGRATTDLAIHDVESKADSDAAGRFDTPSLRFLSGRAPYFHDGRYQTLDALLAGCDGKMGHTGQLSGGDLRALKAYLEVL
jgi:DNA-binding beta-propeller fold protein YncE